MSVNHEIDRIKDNISKSYEQLQGKGANIPKELNSDNLPSTIKSINIGGVAPPTYAEISVKFIYINPDTGKQIVETIYCNKGGTIVPPNATDVMAKPNICPDLTFQGWNYDLSVLSDIQNNLCIGAMYAPTDGKSHAFIELTKTTGIDPTDAFTQVIYLNIIGNGNTYIDWGDGVTDTLTNTGNVNKTHTYATYGKYEVKIWRSEGSYDFGNGTSATVFLGGNVFPKVVSLKYMYIQSDLTSINLYAFVGCQSLIQITLPSSLISIGNNAFATCYSLTHITLPSSLISIGNYVFLDCRSLTQIALSNSITSIGNNAFQNCYVLTHITLPSSFTSISNSVLQYCYGLTQIALPNSITSIGNSALQYCYGLTQITLPSSLTSIGTSAFHSCFSIVLYDFSNLKQIPTATNTNLFLNINYSAKIIVPDSLYSSWIATTIWSTYANYIVKASDYNASL